MSFLSLLFPPGRQRQSRAIKAVAMLAGLGIASLFALYGYWYTALPVGLVGYLVTRYAAWALARGRAENRETDQLVKEIERGERPDA
jgi:hypothetical protein